MKSYRCVDGEYSVRQEIKRSVFIASVKGELDADGAEEWVKQIRRLYPDATHNCYAYISDELGNCTRFSDDGEPSGTAGQPILDVLRKNGLVRTAIVVTRYFGGIKLGAGGLVGAYSGAAAEVVKAANIALKQQCEKLRVICSYSDAATLEGFVRHSAYQFETEYGSSVEARVFVPTDLVEAFALSVSELTAGRAIVTQTGVYQYKKVG